MNKLTRFYPKALMMLSLLLTGYASKAQTTIFLEKMGTVTTTTSVAAHETANGFDNNDLTMTVAGAASGNSADIRRTNNIGTDGTNDANVWLASGVERNFAIEGIDASGYTNLMLEFAYRKEQSGSLPVIELAYWDGATYVPVAFTFAEAATATAGWYTVTGIQLPAAAQINGLKLRWKKENTSIEARLDEVKLTGTVAAPAVNPTIASTLNGRTGVVVGVQEAYDVTTTAGSMAGDMVKVKATLADPTQAANMTLEFFETTTSTWMPLTFDASGVLLFGPATGFPLANATTNFRVTYSAAGTYATTLEIVDAATGVAIVPGTTESVTVTAPAVAPTISSDLAGRTGVKTTVEENFAVTTTTGTHANHMVKVKMALVTPAQAADITLLYEATPGNFLPLTFNAAGEVEFGPATGFLLANAATNFKITFDAAGTYDYTLAIVDAATGTTLATPTAESVTVAAFVNPTIASTLNGRTGVLTGVQETYSVTTTAGDMAGDLVKVKATLATPAQAADMTLEYFETTTSTWMPLTFDASGVLLFGPATGFPLANATTDFRVTYNAAGTYTTTLEIVDAVTGVAVAPGVTESVTVTVPVVAPTIASTLNARAGVLTTVDEEFEVTTTAGTYAGQNILVKMTLTTPAQAADMDVQYFETTTSQWLPLTFDASGVLTFGPATGFPLANATSDFKVTFGAAGTYAYTLEIVDAANPTTILATASESVTVTAFVAPTIVSNLDGRTGVVMSREEEFLIATTAGNNAGDMVKIKITLTNPAQGDDMDLSVEDAGGNFQPVTFNASGEFVYGPAAGIALADDTVNFKVAFNATGVYEYTLAIVDAVTGVVIGDTVVESVTILVNSVKGNALARSINLYPNPATDNLNIDLGAHAKAEVAVMDLTGKLVTELQHVSGAAVINVGGLKAATYMLRIQTAEGIAFKRFVVVR